MEDKSHYFKNSYNPNQDTAKKASIETSNVGSKDYNKEEKQIRSNLEKTIGVEGVVMSVQDLIEYDYK